MLAQWTEARLVSGRSKPSTVKQQRHRMVILFEGELDEPPEDLTRRWATEVYARHIERPCKTGRTPAVATHQQDVRIARIFFKWAMKERLVRENPFASVELVGRPNAGKRQLRVAEARAFTSAALAMFEQTRYPLALGAVLALWLGLRTGEILGALVRDVDDGARLLWVERGKTKNARRHLIIPEQLRPALLRLVAGRGGTEPLFSYGGVPFSRMALWSAVRRLCELADVPVVCTHALRGTHATLALDAGASPLHVAAALGHASFSMTAAHYVAPGLLDEANARKVSAALVMDLNRSRIDPKTEKSEFPDGD
jgi:integrase